MHLKTNLQFTYRLTGRLRGNQYQESFTIARGRSSKRNFLQKGGGGGGSNNLHVLRAVCIRKSSQKGESRPPPLPLNMPRHSCCRLPCQSCARLSYAGNDRHMCMHSHYLVSRASPSEKKSEGSGDLYIDFTHDSWVTILRVYCLWMPVVAHYQRNCARVQAL